VISYVAPSLQEICAVCGKLVHDRDVFRCMCGQGDLIFMIDGFPTDLCTTADDGFTPTVECSICSAWHHVRCSTEFICGRTRIPGCTSDLRSRPTDTIVLAEKHSTVSDSYPNNLVRTMSPDPAQMISLDTTSNQPEPGGESDERGRQADKGKAKARAVEYGGTNREYVEESE
jgi:hypothetical protein